MKIAIGFFGLPRCSQLAMPSVESKFIQPLQRLGEVRLFHHLYLQKTVSNARSGEDGELPEDNYGWFSQSCGELESPDGVPEKVGFDAVQKFGDFWSDGLVSLRNLMLQLHSLSAVTRRMATFDPDVSIFLRPDLVYHDGVSARYIDYLLKRPDACILPSWQWWGGYNDRLALCGKDIFQGYGGRLELAKLYCERNRLPLHSEKLVQFALCRQKARVRMTNLRASRVRIGGVLKEEIFDPKASWGEGLSSALKWRAVALSTSLSSIR
jgi:hypothetical protein